MRFWMLCGVFGFLEDLGSKAARVKAKDLGGLCTGDVARFGVGVFFLYARLI